MARILDQAIAACPDGRLISYDAHGRMRSQTYDVLWRRAGQLAVALRRRIGQDQPHAVLLFSNSVDFAAAFWGCLRAGLTVVPLSSAAEAVREGRDDGTDLSKILRTLRRPIILTDETFWSLGEQWADAIGGDFLHLADVEAEGKDGSEFWPSADPLCLISTSGSTGTMKLAALSSDAIYHRTFGSPTRSNIRTHSYLFTFAMDSIGGLSAVFLASHLWVQISPALWMRRPLAVLEIIRRHEISSVILSNSVAALINAAHQEAGGPWDMACLKRALFGGEPISPPVMRRFAEVLHARGAVSACLLGGYGTTETGPLLVGWDMLLPLSNGDSGAAPLGQSLQGVSLRVVGETGEEVGEGQEGEVQVYCPHRIFSGYWGADGLYLEGFTGDGWWRTGDLGRLDDGCLTLLGRSKETVVVRGRKVALAAVDAHLQTILDGWGRAISCSVMWPGEHAERLAVVVTPSVGQERTLSAEMIAKIRGAAALRFGLRADPVVAVQAEHIPLTTTGKVRRRELASRLAAGAVEKTETAASIVVVSETDDRDPISTRLSALWREALGARAGQNPGGDFFAAGGDSLNAIRLFCLVEEHFGRVIDPEVFFAAPTLDTLRRLICDTIPTASEASPATPIPWPLSPDLRRNILKYVESWPGLRLTRDRLAVGLNTNGSRPPLFWVFQDASEFSALADHLGRDQPLYGFRSGHLLLSYSEDEIQSVALRYVHEISEIQPQGPLFVGGNCQGGIIALAVAQHLARRKRHVPLLILLEWFFSAQAYAGRTVLAYGRDDINGEGLRFYRSPEAATSPLFADCAVALIPGAHGRFFNAPNVEPLAQALAEHMRAALSAAPLAPPREAWCARLTVIGASLPSHMEEGEKRHVLVEVENVSPVTWGGWKRSGLMLCSYWIDGPIPVVPLDGRVPLPALAPGEKARLTVPITAPAPIPVGTLQVIVDIMESGRSWFSQDRTAALCANVVVIPRRSGGLMRKARSWLGLGN